MRKDSLAGEATATKIAADCFLAPIELDSQAGVGPLPSKSGKRASDKGFLPMSAAEYLSLLDGTGRQLVAGKIGVIPADLPPILDRLGLTAETWLKLTTKFGKLFCRVAGKKESLPRVTPANIPHRFHAGHAALLGPPPNPSSLTGPAS